MIPPLRATAWPVLAIAAAIVAGLALPRPGISDDDIEAGRKAIAVAAPTPQFKGANYCSSCHSPSNENKLPHDWVSLDEFPIWEQRDRHEKAYLALKCDRAKQIERLMKMPADKPATNDERCLACHSLDLSHGDSGKLLGEAGSERREAAVAQGVSCEACHGASSEWFGPHAEPALWRNNPKRADGRLYDEYGMTNLRDPVKRTEVCLSCHLGDISAGKFVTHEMYAAGHPPLPAFDFETFSERMPRHWRLASEANQRPPSSKMIELEGLVDLRASIRILADQTDAARTAGSRTKGSNLGTAEFALYDCAACHHELAIPSQRQERGYFDAAPGRPPLKYSTLPLAEPALTSDSKPAQPTGARTFPAVETILAPLHAAVKSRPFGDPAVVHAAAVKAAAELQSAIESLERSPPVSPELRR